MIRARERERECVCVCRFDLGDLASSELLEEFCQNAPKHNPGW